MAQDYSRGLKKTDGKGLIAGVHISQHPSLLAFVPGDEVAQLPHPQTDS